MIYSSFSMPRSILYGDILKVPKLLQTVQTFGAVYVPKQVVYEKGLTMRKVINESGGFSSNSILYIIQRK